jgi:hypothetical protein
MSGPTCRWQYAPASSLKQRVLCDAQGMEKFKRSLAMGVDVVGGILRFERTVVAGAGSRGRGSNVLSGTAGPVQ